MSQQRLVRLGLHVINVDAVVNCHWEKGKLIVRYVGGGFDVLHDENAKALWRIVSAVASEVKCEDVAASV
jgi:hypothetical protein